MRAFSRLKPGWYLLVALIAYALVATVAWRASVVALRDLRREAVAMELEWAASVPVALAGTPSSAAATSAAGSAGASAVGAGPLAADVGLWFPIPGAHVPDDDDHLPGAPRPYRGGTSEGFVFRADASGVPIAFGTPVIAAGDGEVIRVDEPFAELDAVAWEALLADVAEGADADQLDLLRGRQVWVRLDDGREVRYGHLAGVRRGLSVGQRVARGRVLAFVGNSGTFDSVQGTTTNPRLHFEVRDGATFAGEGLDADGVRMLAATLFTGP